MYTCVHGTLNQTGKDVSGAPTYRCSCYQGWTGAEYEVLSAHDCMLLVARLC